MPLHRQKAINARDQVEIGHRWRGLRARAARRLCTDPHQAE
ncbi:hypothetical protein [Mesorhizobium sp.]